jgi:HAD superfamily hydrolase (TIGR01459 family)
VDASPERPFGDVVPVTGVAPLARDHDGFILDQWGVLHDGTRPYPGAVDCLEQLRRVGKHVVILSNSGRREEGNIRLMAELGFERGLYDRFVSAGEDAREAIERRLDPFHARLGRRYYAFTRDDNVSLLAGLAVERVGRVEDADFLMVIGIDSPRRMLADYEAELAAAAARRLPMVCANPDITRVSPEGLVDAPGALARRYEALGGGVFYHGKPHPPIYAACFRALQGCRRERIVAVGDSIEHDILGAERVGLASAFVTGGIHVEELEGRWGEMPDAVAWSRFLEGAAARPDYLLPAFIW